MPTRELFAGYMRNFIFGVEDGLVSTVGLLSGIAVAGISKKDIVLTGVVLILVEAFSMAVGSFLAERSTEEYAIGRDIPLRYPIVDGIIMFLSYFVAGFLPLSPYLWLGVANALWLSIALSLLALFGLGLASAKVSRVGLWHSAMRMFIIGGIAIGVGVIAGRWIK